MTIHTDSEPVSAAADTAATPSPRAPRGSRQLKAVQPFLTFIGFVILFAVFGGWLGGKFLVVSSRMLDVHQNAPIYLLGLAAMVTLACGQFDLSIASMATLTSFTTLLLCSRDGWPMPLVIVVSVAIGAAGGLLNALLVVRLRVNAFVATLGTGGVFAGIAEVASGGTQVVPDQSHPLPGWFTGTGSFGDFGKHFPAWLLWIGIAAGVLGIGWKARQARPTKVATRAWDGICLVLVLVVLAVLFFVLRIRHVVNSTSWTVGVLLVVTLIVWLALELTVSGRNTYAVGDNSEAARLAGVKVERTTIKAFVLGGMLAGTAGVFLLANQGSAVPDDAAAFLLPAFAAAFLSTVLFSTGRFNVWGTLVGGVFLEWVSQGLIAGGVHYTWTGIVNGAVLILAVAFSTTFRRAIRR